MWGFKRRTVARQINCDACPEVFLAYEENMVRVVDHGNLCQVCYELLKAVRGSTYWLAVQAKWYLNPYKIACGCSVCSPVPTKPPTPYGLPDGYAE